LSDREQTALDADYATELAKVADGPASRYNRLDALEKRRRRAGLWNSRPLRFRLWSSRKRATRSESRPRGGQRTVVEVLGDHSLKADLAAVSAAVRSWLAAVLVSRASKM